MNNIDIALDYIDALKHQYMHDNSINSAFQALDAENTIFSTASFLLKTSYGKLVENLIGSDLYGWVEWWMYETDFGTRSMEFMINHKAYDSKDMDPRVFIELVIVPMSED